jgi:hypothetical protein
MVALYIGIALLVLVVAASAWVGMRAFLAKGELESAIPLASAVQQQVVTGDGATSIRASTELSRHASRAANLTSDPVWRAFEVIPWVGPNLTAVRESAAVVDEVATRAVLPLAQVAGGIQLSSFKPVDGVMDLQPLLAVQPQILAADTALIEAARRANSIDTGETLEVVQRAVTQLKSAVDSAANSVNAVNRAVQVVPAMLGATGPRNYVVMFQNPAELRSTGGIAGALALVHTENGHMDLAQQASSTDFPVTDAPVLELPVETRGLYGDITGQFIQDVNLTPNFPLSAQLAREMWKQQFGVEADGVISIDPVALGYLLKATGPVTLPTGDVLSADNAVQLLLSDVYARYPNTSAQDAFFAAAAASVFSAVSTGDVDPKALITALAKAGGEHRVLVWSAHDQDQAVLAGTTLAGGLPVSDADTQRFGVYLNDATGAKMDMYLDVKIGLGQVTCRNDGRPNYGVDVTLTNTAPADAAISLPAYVTAGGAFGVTPGNVKTLIAAYGPPETQGLGVLRDGVAVAYQPTTDTGHPVSQVSVELAPGESTTLHLGWLGNAAFTGSVVVQSTPVIQLHPVEDVALTCGDALWG